MNAHAEAPGGIDKSADVGEEGSVDGVEDGHLGEGQTGAQKHDTDNQVTDDKSGRTALLKGTTRTDEKTSTNCATCCG